jgi:hypothetical protein
LTLPKRKKDDSNIATILNYDVASSSSWFKSIYNLEMGITRVKGSQRLLPPFKLNTLNEHGKADLHLSPCTHLPQEQAPRILQGKLKRERID